MRALILLFTFLISVFAHEGFVLLESGKSGKDLIKSVSSAISKAGFVPADERDLAVAYQKQFEQSDFDLYYNLTVIDAKALAQTLPANPRISAFAPYTVLIYQKKGAKNSYVGYIKAKAIATSLDLKDKKTVDTLQNSETALLKAIKAELKDAKDTKLAYTPSLKHSAELLFETAIKLKPTDNAITKKEALQKEFESTIEVEGFKISNITDLKSEIEKVKGDMSKYDFFETYSICKLKVIYNASKERPETGVFAPCSVFFYKLKGENAIHVGFPPTANWTLNANITNSEHIKVMSDAENIVKNFFKEQAE